MEKCWQKGFYVRYGGDTIQLGLPFIVSREEIDAVIVEEKAALDAVLTEATERLSQLEDVLQGFERGSLQDLYSALDHLDDASRDLAILMEAMKDRPFRTLRKGVPAEDDEEKKDGSGG